MSSSPVLDIDALVQPISGAATPGGVPLPESLRAELERLRNTAPVSADGGAGGRRPAPDFRAIVEDTKEALTNTSKDLALVLRLVEAVTRVHGVVGLRDGLRLTHRVVADCWDWVHPASPTGRGNRFKWLNSSDGGAEFPLTVQRLPLVRCGTDSFSYFDTLDPTRSAELDAALSNCVDKELVTTHADLTEASAALQSLSAELRTRLGDDDSPDFTSTDKPNLGLAVRNCLQFVSQTAARRNVSLNGAIPAESSDTSPTAATASGEQAVQREGGSRESLYQQLDRIAAALKRIEPHSPVPYLLERCVKLGTLPFPELMKSVLRDSAALTELDRLLGLESSG